MDFSSSLSRSRPRVSYTIHPRLASLASSRVRVDPEVSTTAAGRGPLCIFSLHPRLAPLVRRAPPNTPPRADIDIASSRPGVRTTEGATAPSPCEAFQRRVSAADCNRCSRTTPSRLRGMCAFPVSRWYIFALTFPRTPQGPSKVPFERPLREAGQMCSWTGDAGSDQGKIQTI